MPAIIEIEENTIGYFLKEIRKKYSLDQKDLCGGNVKRSKIAKIEINDTSITLTEEYAKEIAKNINSAIKKYGEEIDYLYFYDNALYKITQEAKAIEAELQMYFYDNDYSSFKKLSYEFINGYSQYSIPSIKCRVFTLAGKFHGRLREYHTSYVYYTRAFDNAIETNNKDEIIKSKICVGISLFYLGNYDATIKHLNQMLTNETNSLSIDHRFSIHNGIGHAYLKLKKIDAALLEFEKSSKFIDSRDLFRVSDLYLQRAYCNRFLEKLPQAIDILKSGINILSSELYEELKYRKDLFGNRLYNTKLCLYKNIISAYRFVGDNESMEKYIRELLLIMDCDLNEKDSFIIDICIDLFSDYIYLENYEAANLCILKAYDLSKNQNNLHYQNKALKIMFELYKQKGDNEKISLLFPEVKNLLSKYPGM